MKKLLSIFIILSILFSYGVAFAEDSNNVQDITIQLNDEGKAKVMSGDTTFDVVYKLHNGGVTIGNGDNYGIFELLTLASELSGEKYDLYIRNKATLKFDNDYSLVLTAYKENQEGYSSFQNIVTQDDSINIYKVIEFYSGATIRNNGHVFSTYDNMPAPHLFFESGKYQYFLPLRYIFEELGFNVEWNNESNTITITFNHSAAYPSVPASW